MMAWWQRLRRLWGRRRHEADIRDELAFHVEEEFEARRAAGLDDRDARREAKRDLGQVALITEDTRAVWRWTTLEQLARDVAAGGRILTRSPGLSAAVILLLAVVIGGNTTIYSMVHTILDKPAPGVDGRGLLTLEQRIDGRPVTPAGISFADYRDLADQLSTIRPLLAYEFRAFTLTLPQGSYAVRGASVTPNYFETIGATLFMGRSFSTEEATGGPSEIVAIIGHRLWQDEFRGSPSAVGTGVLINGHPATVIGVAPPGFRGLSLTEQSQIWVPLEAWRRRTGSMDALGRRDDRSTAVVGRLTAGAALSDARNELAAISGRIAAAFPETHARWTITPVRYSMTAGGDGVVARQGPQFLAIFSLVTMVTLTVVCANVGNLLLARVVARRREMAVRLTLGASRFRILRLLLAEGAVLACGAWCAAALSSWWMASALPDLIDAPILLDFSPDWRVLGYAMLLAVVSAAVFSIVPAMNVWRQPLLPSLKCGEAGNVRGRSRLSSVLAAVQLTCCVLLLTMACLAYRSLSALGSMPLGIDMDHLALVKVNTAATAVGPLDNVVRLERLREILAHVPGSIGATHAGVVPPFGLGVSSVRTSVVSEAESVGTNRIGPGFFDLLRVPILSGREFSDADIAPDTRVVVVNQYLAERLWPGESALGRTLLVSGDSRPVEVIGVVANARVTGPTADPRPYHVYLPVSAREPGMAWFYARHTGEFDAFVRAARATLRREEPRVPIEAALTMEEAVGEVTSPVRTITSLLGLFAVGSLVIAAVGLYGVLAFNMRRRVRELGVRIALGASAPRVMRAVVLEGLRLTGVGLAGGFLLSLLVANVARGVLVGVTPTDAPTYAGVFLLLAIIALVASYVPARRAAGVDPIVALRQE